MLLPACGGEPVHVASYEWLAPGLETQPYPLYPGAVVNAPQTELLQRARALNRAERTATHPRVILYETDAPLDAIESYYAAALAGKTGREVAVTRGGGDFASDEARLGPVLARLGCKYEPGISKGTYRTVVIRGGSGRPTVSLQRPYRDFVRDRVVDRTSILISE